MGKSIGLDNFLWVQKVKINGKNYGSRVCEWHFNRKTLLHIEHLNLVKSTKAEQNITFRRTSN